MRDSPPVGDVHRGAIRACAEHANVIPGDPYAPSAFNHDENANRLAVSENRPARNGGEPSVARALARTRETA
jgi:hypothetical protein